VQLAYAELNGEPVVEFFKPSGDWGMGAIATHHIFPDDVADCRPSAAASGSLPASRFVVGHNVDFDADALGGLPGVNRICTLAMARATWPDADSFKLGALAYRVLGVTAETRDMLRNAHDAGVDVFLCRAIMMAIIAERGLPRDWRAIHRASEADRIPNVIGFGKHKGTAIGKLPGGYKKWLLSTDDLCPYLRIALTS
jgi:exodeoxyribonuclease X